MIEGLRNLMVFAIVLGGLIFFHELGHFLVAIRLGIKVKEFGLGFPPRLFRIYHWRGTDFTINAIPFGGFVRPVGEDDPSIVGGLAAAAPWRRVAVLVAGSATNILLAVIVLTPLDGQTVSPFLKWQKILQLRKSDYNQKISFLEQMERQSAFHHNSQQ